jgi:Subtilase family
MSLGIAYNTAIEQAIDLAHNNYGVFLDCSSGNGGGIPVAFPANHQYVVSVGATNNADFRATFSNFGANLDIAAPGVSIISTHPSTYITNANGTSFAAPHVAGVAALMLSVNPSLTPDEIRCIMQVTADQVGGYDYTVVSPCKSLELGFGRVNAHQAVSMAQNYSSGTKTITSNTTWSTPHLSTGIIVESGVQLKITSNVIFCENSKVYVKLGGKLIVDGGILASASCGLWQGIEVEGDINTSQIDPIVPHGRVEVINGSLIENAIVGISAHTRFSNGSSNIAASGGIIFASNSTFKNNLKDIEFLSYQNFIPTPAATPVVDISSIRNCKFIWDNTGNMFSLGFTANNRAHLSMLEVHGIDIQGNEFRNDFPSNSPNFQKGNGIVSIDADYFVDEACNSISLPCNLLVPNLFQHLNIGIRAQGINAMARVKIDGNIFNENRFGVILEATEFTTVSRNRFNLPISTITLEDGGDAIGIFSIGSDGYDFQENTFTTTGLGPSNGSNYGIVSDNSSLIGGLVYKNDFNNTIVGNLSSQDNTVLTVDCNTHNAGFLQRYDMAVTSGTLKNQGNCSFLPANNIFDPSCTGEENIFHYTNTPANLIYSALNGTSPTCVTFPEVFVVPCSPSDPNNTCPSNINNPTTPTAILSIINTTKGEIATLNTQFDGGDQNNLISIINNQSNGQVKDELLTASPYLSDKVLVTFLGKPNPLPAGHIKQIIVANSPVTIKVKQKLDNITLPKGIRNQIDAVQTGISERQLLENQITQLEVKIQLLKNDFIRQCLDLHLIADIKNILNEDKMTSDKAALLPLIVKTDQQQADQLITALRADANDLRIEDPNSEKADDIDKLCDFFTCVKDRIIVSGDFNQLTASDEQIMRSLAATSSPIAINAQNTLDFFKGEVVERFAEPIIVVPNTNRVMNTDTSTFQYSSYNYELNNYPNPFNENTVIEVTIPVNTKGKLLITDVTGRQLKQIELSQTENEVELNGNKLGYGVFFYSLYINDEFVTTKKMTRMR